MAAPDPRGPLRTVASADFTPSGYVVCFVECDHVARTNATMTVRAGERCRCFACGPCAPAPVMPMPTAAQERAHEMRDDARAGGEL